MNSYLVLENTTKAGNYQRLDLKNTIILWNERKIIHQYEINVYDGDGDKLAIVKSADVKLDEASFAQWITDQMVQASLNTCLEDTIPPVENL